MNYHKSDQSQTLAIMVNKPLMQHPCARWFDVTNSVVFQLNLKKSFFNRSSFPPCPSPL